jgi:hypothetical protein
MSRRTIMDWLKTGEIPSYKLGGDPSDVDLWLAQRRQERAA